MIIIRPFFTKKSLDIEKNNFYTFLLSNKYNKHQIKQEIYNIFGVEVKSVKTIIYPKKNKYKSSKKILSINRGRSKRIKKAIIQFKDNKKINIIKNKQNLIVNNNNNKQNLIVNNNNNKHFNKNDNKQNLNVNNKKIKTYNTGTKV